MRLYIWTAPDNPPDPGLDDYPRTQNWACDVIRDCIPLIKPIADLVCGYMYPDPDPKEDLKYYAFHHWSFNDGTRTGILRAEIPVWGYCRTSDSKKWEIALYILNFHPFRISCTNSQVSIYNLSQRHTYKRNLSEGLRIDISVTGQVTIYYPPKSIQIQLVERPGAIPIKDLLYY